MASSNFSSKSNRRPFKWAIDFNSKSKSERAVSQAENLIAPIGYTDRQLADYASPHETAPDLVVKRSWDVALAPIKQVPMNIFIMWMAGSSIGIFPIMMVGMMFIRPIQALIAAQTTFKMIEGNQQAAQRCMYLFGNLVCLALAIYKCQVMGLLPTHPSDWLAFVEPQRRMEWSGGGLSMS